MSEPPLPYRPFDPSVSMSGALPGPPEHPPQRPPMGQHSSIEDQMLGPAALENLPPSASPQHYPGPLPGPPPGPPPGQFGPEPQRPSPYVHQHPDAFRPQRVDPPPSNGPGPGPGPSHDLSYGYDPASVPAPPVTPMITMAPPDLRTQRSTSHEALKEFAALVRTRQEAPPGSTISADVDKKLRRRARYLLEDLTMLRGQLREVARERESHRWRRWIIGGAVATFIPAVKALFRYTIPPSTEVQHASNDTEYAFNRTRALLARIRQSVLGRGALAGVAFFVFAALYVFQNEVALRVAKTLSRRIKRIVAKIERGGFEVEEGDLKVLEGWRWRVLLWGRGG